MNLRLAILFLLLTPLIFSQGGDLFVDAVNKLSKGELTKSYLMFTKLHQADKNNAEVLAYLSYATTKICYSKDSINPKDVSNALNYANQAMQKDSSLKEARLAKAYSLLLANKNLDSRKEKCKNLLEIKRQLTILNSGDNIKPEVYNLLAIWHRTVASFSEFEKEAAKTFYHVDLGDAKMELALSFHKKAIKENAKVCFLYEQMKTYQAMHSDELETSVVDKILKTKGKSEEVKLYKALVTN